MNFYLVLPLLSSGTHEFKNALNDIPFDITISPHTGSIADLIYKSDIVICGNGRMVYEATVLNKFVISIPQNSREATHTFCRDFPGHQLLAIHTEVTAPIILEAIQQAIMVRQQLAECSDYSGINELRAQIINDIVDASSKTLSLILE